MADIDFFETPRLGDRLEDLDKEIRAWARVNRQRLLYRLASLNLRERAALEGEIKLRESIKNSVRKKDGEIERVSFSFARHGIFLERGVGKGRPVGSPQANAAAKPWLKPVLEPALKELADIFASEYADIIAAELKIVIPGVINTKITG